MSMRTSRAALPPAVDGAASAASGFLADVADVADTVPYVPSPMAGPEPGIK